MSVDLSGVIRSRFTGAVRTAEDAERSGNAGVAAAAYRECAQIKSELAGQVRNPKAKRTAVAESREYLERAKRIEREGLRPRTVAGNSACSGNASIKVGEDGESAVREKAADLIQKSQVTWDEIAGLEDTKRDLKAGFGLSLARRPAKLRIRRPMPILLYGPPGTGKTLLAAAISHGLEAVFFNVRLSRILSKYFGESSQMISAVYDLARERAPSVVFIDEVESITPSRSDDVSGPERRVLATLLSELDGMADKGKDTFVLTVAATNTPWIIDDAVLSRFGRSIHVPLPDHKARRRMFEIHLIDAGYRLGCPLEEWVEQSEGCSGREIQQISTAAVEQMLIKANPEVLRLVDQGREALQSYELKVLPVDRPDMKSAFRKFPPRTDPDSVKRYAAWRNHNNT